jgi:hypothetical protein
MARFVIKRFSDGWYRASGAARRTLGWSISECAAVQMSRNPDGVFTSGVMPSHEALRIAAAFELSGCEVDVIE